MIMQYIWLGTYERKQVGIVKGTNFRENVGPERFSPVVKAFEKVQSSHFKLICKKIIVTTIFEAELIKLFSNAWRYINFSGSDLIMNV